MQKLMDAIDFETHGQGGNVTDGGAFLLIDADIEDQVFEFRIAQLRDMRGVLGRGEALHQAVEGIALTFGESLLPGTLTLSAVTSTWTSRTVKLARPELRQGACPKTGAASMRRPTTIAGIPHWRWRSGIAKRPGFSMFAPIRRRQDTAACAREEVISEPHSSAGLTYAQAGVDIDAGTALVDAIKPLAGATARKGTAASLGGFGALFDLRAAGFNDPILVSTTDGVGTKLKVAIACGRHSGVGIDLVAMCVNDLVVQGAEPLFFLDLLCHGASGRDGRSRNYRRDRRRVPHFGLRPGGRRDGRDARHVCRWRLRPGWLCCRCG